MNRIKKALLTGMIFAAASAASFASSVAFQIIQSDDSTKKVRSACYIIEDTLFEYFFDQGVIATNSPTEISSDPADDPKIYARSSADARDGFCDWYVQLRVDFIHTETTNPQADLLGNINYISWTVYDADKGEKIASGKKETATAKKSMFRVPQGIGDFTFDIAREIDAAIIKYSRGY